MLLHPHFMHWAVSQKCWALLKATRQGDHRTPEVSSNVLVFQVVKLRHEVEKDAA